MEDHLPAITLYAAYLHLNFIETICYKSTENAEYNSTFSIH